MSRSFLLQVLDKGAQFLQATESGDVERVKQMVAEFVNVNTRNEVRLFVFDRLMMSLKLYLHRRKRLHYTLLPDVVILI